MKPENKFQQNCVLCGEDVMEVEPKRLSDKVHNLTIIYMNFGTEERTAILLTAVKYQEKGDISGNLAGNLQCIILFI